MSDLFHARGTSTSGLLARWLLQPLGWGTQFLAVLAFCVGLWALASIDRLGFLLPMFLLFVLAALAWLGGFLVRIFAIIFYRQPAALLWRGWKRWLLAPILLVIFLLLAGVNLPLRVLFRTSQERMQHVVDAVLSGHAPSVPQQAGFYSIKRCWGDRNSGIYLQTGGPWEPSYSPRGTAGFVYFPDGRIHELQPECVYTPVAENWYAFLIGM